MTNKLLFFANIFVNSKENLIRMEDSFKSIDKTLFNEFVINIRGKYSNEAISFLRRQGIQSLFNINSGFGWFHDTYILTNKIKFKYIFCWLEDQICMNKNYFNDYLKEVYKFDLDIARYTYSYDISNFFDINKFENTKYMYFKLMSKKDFDGIKNGPFIISYGSLMKKELFNKILLDNNPGVWSKYTPFGFEKNSEQHSWLPLKIGFIKKEIFASIDDDHAIHSNSLQSRGLYPVRTKVRKKSDHLTKYILSGKKYLIREKLNFLLVLIKIFYNIMRLNISFTIFIKYYDHIKSKIIKPEHLPILEIIEKNKRKKFLLLSIDNQLSYLSQIYEKLNLVFISNTNFTKPKENNINLIPYNYASSKTDRNLNELYNGFKIEINLKDIDIKNHFLVTHKKIYEIISKELIIKKTQVIDEFVLFDLDY